MAFDNPPASRKSLNSEQQAAVRYLDGPLLVLAGAGSGKTRVITRKIAYLLRECGYAAENVAAVTFTNKAAREMKTRVGELLGAEAARGLVISTFHTLGLRILQREHQAAGYKRGFTIFDADDSRTLIGELLKADNMDLAQTVDRLLWKISAWKSAQRDPGAALAGAQDAEEQRMARVYAHYERNLRAYNAVDFDDLILKPVQLFRQQPDVLRRWREKLRYLLVDEYQDTNAAQYALLKLLAGPRAAFTVVGDDDQSIYSWRGAQPENLNLLQQDFPALRVIKLEQNYRSSARILRVANKLIAGNPHLFEKQLWSRLPEGEPVRVLACGDAQHEAERVVTAILSHQLQHKSAWHDYAILYRGNHQARLFEKLLREHRVPYHLSGGTSFFDRGEVRDIIAYLRLLVNPDDDAAFLRVVNVPRREIGAATLEKLGEYAGRRHCSLFAAIFELGLERQLAERPLARLREFARFIVEAGDAAERGEPVRAVKELIDDIGYETWLRDTCRDLKTAENRFENVQELVQWFANLAKQEQQERSLADMLAHMSLMDMLDRTGKDEPQDCVHLMTLHAAKGLEFPHVYLVGVEEEQLPHRNSIEAETVEEERRLMYVGITRAQFTLTLTYAEKRRRYGEDIVCEPSRFLSELPMEDLNWEGRGGEASAEEKIATGRSHLAGLRGLLAEG